VASSSPHFAKALALLVLAVLVLAIYVGLDRGWLGPLSPEETDPFSDLPTADLGTVLIPTTTPPGRALTYVWRVDTLEPPRYQLGYGLGASLVDALEREHRELGERLHFRPLSRDRFTYRAPPHCGTDMRCVYEELMRTNTEPVRQLGEPFLEFIRTHQLSSPQAANLIIGFVQRIHYELPDKDVPFGVIPPALVPAQDRGDCDSKALLAVMLLRQAGIDAVLLYSDPLAHAAVGVGLPGRGTALQHGGRTWRYAELSTEGWPIGMIPPQYDKPRLWTVLPLSDASH
jgi:hypothetical protein